MIVPCNARHVFGRTLHKTIQESLLLDDPHLGDVLIVLRNAGCRLDCEKGLYLAILLIHPFFKAPEAAP